MSPTRNQVTIYHNPRCSKSRQTLALLAERGIDATVIEYLETPPSVEDLGRILGFLGLSPRQLMRKKEQAYTENGLGAEDLSPEDLITAMHRNPILIERPIVVVDEKAAIGRPPEDVLSILP